MEQRDYAAEPRLNRPSDEEDHFKQEFKYYKKKKPPPNLSNVIDFASDSSHPDVHRIEIDAASSDDRVLRDLGLVPRKEWAIYTIIGKKGFYFVRNPFTIDGQKEWIRRSLEEYTRKPSITNLDNFQENIDVIWSPEASKENNSKLKRLRWATFGYHHNWKTKVYTEDRRCLFPNCLKNLSQHVAASLGFDEFLPEAAIVNYYDMSSQLGGHVDSSEYDEDAPLLSFSFGQSAIFLLGSETKSVRPLPMFIRSGDIVVMSGPSRMVYHGIPSMIKDPAITDRYWRTCTAWKPFAEYINTSRINITVRQVLKNAVRCLP